MIMKSEENDEMVGLGRCRGGYTTKIHVLTDGAGTLLAVTATPGQRNESTEFAELLARCNLSTRRVKKRPVAIAGDKGYSSNAIREQIRKLGADDVIPTRSNETAREGFDRETYRQRNIVERTIGWLKESRRVATRYDKLISSYLTFVWLAAMRRIIKLI
jgi:transposase